VKGQRDLVPRSTGCLFALVIAVIFAVAIALFLIIPYAIPAG
jgi:formate hydrogenlyase subunit 4